MVWKGFKKLGLAGMVLLAGFSVGARFGSWFWINGVFYLMKSGGVGACILDDDDFRSLQRCGTTWISLVLR